MLCIAFDFESEIEKVRRSAFMFIISPLIIDRSLIFIDEGLRLIKKPVSGR